MKTIYKCEYCDSIFECFNDASKCESAHTPLDDIHIIGVEYKPSCNIPSSLEVRFVCSNGIDVYHTYSLNSKKDKYESNTRI